MHMSNSQRWHEPVLQCWFEEIGEAGWFASDPALDAAIRTRFADLHAELATAPLERVGSTPPTCLAAIVVLDQFSRNMFRGTPRAFMSDPLALSLARHAVAAGFDQQLGRRQRLFIYLPYEHSEAPAMQACSLQLFRALADPLQLHHAQQHHDIIARFGRFPHRNAILGRASTAEELQFLQQHPGF